MSFLVVNTHFDDIGRNARQKSAELIGEFISESDTPAILTGDLNDNPQSGLYEKLSNNADGLKDTHVIAKSQRGANYTFHSFGIIPKERRTKIDYILKGPFELKSEEIPEESNEGGAFLSDHNPIIVVMSLS
jgi:endonuclease/exonuclease/phosphatase family metal-dependent hydrolase